MSTRATGNFPVTGPTRKTFVYVVDDDESFRVGLTRMLRAAGYEALGFASAGEFLLAHRAEGPGCVLLDVHLPGPSGLDLQEAIGKTGESLPVIFISGQGSIPASVRAMKAGAVDFLTKPVKREVLLEAIKNAVRVGGAARIERDELRIARELYETLTPREREVFQGIVGGKLNKEVAEELGTTERTVKAQRANVMAKMKVSSFADLVRIGYRLQANQPRSGSRGSVT
jgi:FixJ family two-component response regulator